MQRKAPRTIWSHARTEVCPACGRPFARRDERVRIGGVTFHRSCALFQSRSGGPSAA